MSKKENILVFYDQNVMSLSELQSKDFDSENVFFYNSLKEAQEHLEQHSPYLIYIFHKSSSQEAQNLCIRFSELIMFDSSSMVFVYPGEMSIKEHQLLTTLGVAKFFKTEDDFLSNNNDLAHKKGVA